MFGLVLIFFLAANQETKGDSAVRFFQPPILNIKTSYLDINSSNTLQIDCRGKYPLLWKLPDKRETVFNETRLSIFILEEKGKSGDRYSSQLTLQDVIYADTGLYSCYYEGTIDFKSRSNVTSVYAFVNDEENMFVDKYVVVGGKMHRPVFSNRTAILPCLPTNSQANVTLWKLDSGIDEGEMMSLAPEDLFDPTQGFIIKSINVSYSGIFECRATLGNQTESIGLILQFNSETKWTPQPRIPSNGRLDFIAKSSFTLQCYVNIELSTIITLHWSHPIKNISRFNATEPVVDSYNDALKTAVSYLFVTDAHPADSGTYTCSVTDHSNKTGSDKINVTVYETQPPLNLQFETDIDISKPSTFQAGSNVQFIILIEAFPNVKDFKFMWLKDDDTMLSKPEPQFNGIKYHVKLMLNNLTRSDTGVYTLVGKIRDYNNNISIVLHVEDVPKITVTKAPRFFMLGKNYSLRCQADGLPTPVMQWSWMQCSKMVDCELKAIQRYTDLEKGIAYTNKDLVEYTLHGKWNDSAVAVLNMTASRSGYYICGASNSKGHSDEKIMFIVSDVNNGFGTSVTNSRPVEGDEVVITCKANSFYYSSIHWQLLTLDAKERIEDANITDVTKHMQHTEYSHSSQIIFNHVRFNHSGIYKCVAVKYTDNSTVSSSVSIDVQGIVKPWVNGTNMLGGRIDAAPESTLELSCNVLGVPEPRITWKKDGEDYSVRDKAGVDLTDNDKKLILTRVFEKDSGFYECIAKNRGGVIVLNATLTVSMDGDSSVLDSKHLILMIALLLFGTVFAVMLFFIVRRIRDDKKKKEELAFLDQSVFERGYVDIFNPDLPIQDQVAILPYKHHWEFPKERLKLGKIIGEGAFGRVVKAEAIGVVDGESTTIVAVKMLKETANKDQKNALIAELKILTYLGKHLNIVNLLGAVTKNFAKGELMVMVEYCCQGNLRHFLLKHKNSFVNQLDPETGLLIPLAPSSTESAFTHSYEIALNYANAQGLGVDNPSYGSEFINYANISHSQSSLEGSVAEPSVLCSERYCPNPQPVLARSIDEDDRNCIISTCSLLCFAFQCARGMEYLATKKLIHRDLAARNVLLAKDNIVKICDFGLAKDRHNYKYADYIKKTDGPMPVKWMAVESICDRVFTIKSDVWSFGILLWEMFTLGGNPYPGLEINDEFVRRLKSGYRLEKPELAPDNIYDIMQNCWLADPNRRPDFTQLSETVGSLLEAGVRKYYVELNTPYQVLNDQFFNNNDYLQMSNDDNVNYTKMLNVNTNADLNEYDNVKSIRPIGNGPIPNVPMEGVPMIQLESFSKDAPIRNIVHQRSLSLDNIPIGDVSMNEEFETSKSDDDSVFLDNSFNDKHRSYVNGFLKALQDSSMTTRC